MDDRPPKKINGDDEMADAKLSVVTNENTGAADKTSKKNTGKKKTAKKKKPAQGHDDDTLDQPRDDSAHLRRILDQTAIVHRWHTHVENAKAALKDAATKLKLEQERLNHVITGQEQTYLELKDADDTPVDQRSISVLGLPQDVEGLLAGAGYETIAKMRAYGDGGGIFSNIEGIGEQLGNRIKESLDAYMESAQ